MSPLPPRRQWSCKFHSRRAFLIKAAFRDLSSIRNTDGVIRQLIAQFFDHPAAQIFSFGSVDIGKIYILHHFSVNKSIFWPKIHYQT